ncbi:nose resistant to fluoxetine protein 6 [Aethina tumida]|uniref:nose resistant to fluoxetine protein 6 n=1 Tax=Aethina tumida TaxID=116153 RepID=UPI00096B67EA|nr:nose resistant to fluoxetine protein 6 [Aethina tumida]
MKCVLLLVFLVFSSAFCHGHEVQDTKTDVEKINILEDTAISEDCRRSLKNIGWKNETNDNILESNVIYDLGHFDECVKFSNRKYCIGKHYENENLYHLIQNTSQYLIKRVTKEFSVKYSGRCLPIDCNQKDFNIIFEEEMDEKFCTCKTDINKSVLLSSVTLYVFVGLIILILLSSLYDLAISFSDTIPDYEVLTAFSLITNVQKFFKCNENPEDLSCLNGMKCISVLWIVLYYEWRILAAGPVESYGGLINFLNSSANLIFFQGDMAIDTFFTIGGITTAYAFTRMYQKKGSCSIKDVAKLCMHRYLRMTPVLAAMVLLYATTLSRLGNGPVWHHIEESLVEPCKTYWWTSLLYIQNYINHSDYCIVQSWYLSVDMQMFFLSPLLLIPLENFPKTSISFILCMIAVGIGVNFYISYSFELPYASFALDNNSDIYFEIFYSRLYCRYSAYLLGLVCGWSLNKIRKDCDNFILTKFASIFTWSMMFISIIVCIYFPYVFLHSAKNVTANAFYNSLIRIIFSIAICTLVVLCSTGNGGFVNHFLSSKLFFVMTKLVYSMYLVHFMVIACRIFSTRSAWQFTRSSIMFNYIGDVVITILISFILVILFDFPCMAIHKLIFGKDCCERRKMSRMSNRFKLSISQ